MFLINFHCKSEAKVDCFKCSEAGNYCYSRGRGVGERT